MFQIMGILGLLIATVLIAADSHGADMGKQVMLEPTGFGLLLKYPIMWAHAVGSLIGAGISSYFQKREKLPKFLISFVVGIILSPVFFAVTDIVPLISTALACGLAMGLLVWLILEIIYSPEVRASIRHGVAHQIDKRLADGEHPKEETE